MCGIFGVVEWDGPLDARRVLQATDSLRHRGPDESGFLFDQVASIPLEQTARFLPRRAGALWQVALGHRRLSILDLACGQQPMLDVTGAWAITFNGEIYNHMELREALLAEGAVFQTDHSDTETLLVGFSRWGTAILPKLNGMFAAAIYHRDTGRCWLVRDRFGKKPIYLHHHHDRLIFGSELKALVSYLGAAPALDWDALGDYMMRGCIHEPRTIFQNITKVPAASFIEFDLRVPGGRKVAQSRYWEFQPPDVPDQTRTEDDWLAELEHLLNDAVRIRLISDVPVGTFLSSGIDSALVCAFAARHVGEPLRAFTIGSDDPASDESAAAAQVAAELGLRHVAEKAKFNPATVLPELVTTFDEPFADLSMAPTQQVARLAAREVKVVLTGDGADEFFAGYGVFGHMSTRTKLERVPLLTPLASGLKRRLPISARGHAFLASNFGGSGLARYRSLVETPLLLKLLEPSVARRIRPEWPRLEELWRRSSNFDLLTRVSLLQSMTYLTDDILVKVDRATMAHSLEARSPFLDYRVAEFAARLPAPLKWGGGRGKILLRRLARRWFSESYLNRPKRGFIVPLKKWMQTEMSSDLDDLARCELFSRAEVTRLVAQQRNTGRDYSSPLWRLMVLNRWLKHWRPA